MADGVDKLRISQALRQVLRPVVRLLLKAGFTWQDFADLAKTTFVEVALEDYGKRGRPTNSSRVAILTGLGRHEVARLRGRLATEDLPTPVYMSRGSRVLSGWHLDPDFIGDDGLPRVLRMSGEDGASFEALVRRYAGDVPVVAMFKELLAAGAVAVDGDDAVRVLKRSYVPKTMSDDQVRLWGSVLHDAGATLAHNLTRAEPELPRFERRAVSLAVDARYLPAFRAFLEREGQAFLERVDDWLTSHEVKGDDAMRRRLRLGAGVYHIEGPKLKDGLS